MSETTHETCNRPELTVSWQEIFSRQHIAKLATLSMAVWLHASNSMLTATTMPSAVDEIGGLHLISWAFALYLTGTITAGASMSILVTRWGVRQSMIYAAAVYIVGCVICASAPSMPILLTGRTLQGLGGGALLALVYICQDRFFPNRYAPKIVACLSTVWMFAAMAGPSIGGAFATFGLWRFAFWAFALQGVLLIPAVYYLLADNRKTENSNDEKLPLVRLLLLSSTIVFVSISGAQFHPVTSPLLILCGVASLVIFVRRDRLAKAGRMLPLAASHIEHPICNGILTTILLALCIMSFLVYGPLILIKLYALTPLAAGLVVMVESLAWTIGAVVLSGARPSIESHIIKLGSALVAGGLFAMAYALPNGPLWLVIATAIISNLGFGMMWGFIIKRIVNEAPSDERDRASSLIPITQQTGFAIGAALSGLIANGLGLRENAQLHVFQDVAFWLFTGFIPVALIGNLTAWRFVARFTPTEFAGRITKEAA